MYAAVMVLSALVVITGITVMSAGHAYADLQTPQIIPINDEISLQKTETTLSIPSDNKLPWGAVSGPTSDHLPDYPVIIQFYKGDVPVHIAQVDANSDGSYEYVFRVQTLDSTTNQLVHIFEGNYSVVVFKVIPAPTDYAGIVTGIMV